MSALGQKRTCALHQFMSALPPRAEIPQRSDIFDEVGSSELRSRSRTSFDSVLDELKVCFLGQAANVLPARIKVARLTVVDFLADQTNHVT